MSFYCHTFSEEFSLWHLDKLSEVYFSSDIHSNVLSGMWMRGGGQKSCNSGSLPKFPNILFCLAACQNSQCAFLFGSLPNFTNVLFSLAACQTFPMCFSLWQLAKQSQHDFQFGSLPNIPSGFFCLAACQNY